MAQVPALGCEHWHNELESLRVDYKDLVKQHPDARDAIEKLRSVLLDIVRLAECTPSPSDESVAWDRVVC